jgi:hypothetical protein
MEVQVRKERREGKREGTRKARARATEGKGQILMFFLTFICIVFILIIDVFF